MLVLRKINIRQRHTEIRKQRGWVNFSIANGASSLITVKKINNLLVGDIPKDWSCSTQKRYYFRLVY